MLAQPSPFPFPGSRAFVKVSADPVTIIRRNADGTALVRRDPRPIERRNRDASGNATLPLTDLCETEEAATRDALAIPKRSRNPGKPRPRRAAPQARTGARSDAAKGRTSEDIARADARAEIQQ